MSVAGNDTQLSPDVGSKKVGKWKDRRANPVLSKHLRGGAGYNIAAPGESPWVSSLHWCSVHVDTC